MQIATWRKFCRVGRVQDSRSPFAYCFLRSGQKETLVPNTLKASLPAILAVLLCAAPLSTALADTAALHDPYLPNTPEFSSNSNGDSTDNCLSVHLAMSQMNAVANAGH
jgi:hypothetical protein